jgi:hypothetical protein
VYLQAWLDKHFKNNERPEVVIFENENVLTPSALKQVGSAKVYLH